MFKSVFNLNITQRFAGILLLFGVLPLLATGMVTYTTTRDALLKEAFGRQHRLLRNFEDQLVLIQEQAESLVANIASIDTITNAILYPTDAVTSYQRLSTQAQVGYILNGYLNIKGLVSIDIFGRQGTHFQVGDTLAVREEPGVINKIFEQLEKPESWVYWPGLLPNPNASSNVHFVVPAVKPLYAFDREKLERKLMGVVIVNYSPEALAQRFTDPEQDNGRQIYLLDQAGRYIVHPVRDMVGRQADSDLLTAAARGQTSFFALQQWEAFVTQEPVERTGWTLISVIPKAQLERESNLIRNFNILVFLLAMLVIILTAVYFSKKVVSPIRHVTDAFKRLKEGETNIDKLEISGNDEVSQLAQWFNLFLDEQYRRKASDEALRISEERYELVSRATNEGIWDYDIQSHQVYFSERFKQITGYHQNFSSPSLLGFFHMVHPEDRPKLSRIYREFIDSDRDSITVVNRFLRPDHSIVHVSNNCRAVRNDQGNALRIVGSIQDISVQKNLENRLRHDATHDLLTGLYNRTWMIKRIDRELQAQQSRQENLFVVLFLDLDDFKTLNDTLGHSIGDLLLVQVTQRIEACLRPGDPLARLGGDEFVALLPDIKSSDALTVVHRLVEKVTQTYQLHDHEYRASTSIGVAFSKADYQNAEEILRDADTAMYRAKSKGKGQYEIYDDEMRRLLLQRTSVESDLAEAIQGNQLEMHYQSIMDLTTDQIVGFEALLRWHHPKREISPAEFIPVAEESGLIHQLGDWVLHQVVAQIGIWQRAFQLPAEFRTAINISPKQFSDTHLVDQIVAVLSDQNVDPMHLAIELTETAIFRDKSAVHEYLERLRDLQVSIYLDDFGTGYSSLSYLINFPIDAIKIDQSFIVSLKPENCEVQVVNSLILLARELGIKVIAEGVESGELLDYLRSRSCDYAQGYFIDRPMSAEKATTLLSEHYKNRPVAISR